jgi:hypothetical protein
MLTTFPLFGLLSNRTGLLGAGLEADLSTFPSGPEVSRFGRHQRPRTCYGWA